MNYIKVSPLRKIWQRKTSKEWLEEKEGESKESKLSEKKEFQRLLEI